MAQTSDARYVIREVDGVKHRDILMHMQDKCFPADVPLDPSRGYWWFAYWEGLPVAFACLRDVHREPTVGYLDRAGVRWHHRGHGLQRRLIRVRLNKAKRLGWTTVLTTTHDNPASGNNLFRCGFKMYTPNNQWMDKGTVYWTRAI